MIKLLIVNKAFQDRVDYFQIRRLASRRRTIRMLVFVVVLFTVCWSPLNVYHLGNYKNILIKRVFPLIQGLSLWLQVTIYPLFNISLFYLKGRRKELRNIRTIPRFIPAKKRIFRVKLTYLLHIFIVYFSE